MRVSEFSASALLWLVFFLAAQLIFAPAAKQRVDRAASVLGGTLR